MRSSNGAVDDALFDVALDVAIEGTISQRKARARVAVELIASALRQPDVRQSLGAVRPQLEDQVGRRGAAALIAKAMAMAKPRQRSVATILFTDIVGSTEMAAELGDEAWRDLLAKHNAAVRKVLGRHHGQELDTAGDGFYAVFENPTEALDAAAALHAPLANLGIQVRAGLHVGEVSWSEGKAVGLAVSTGARVAALAQAGEVFVSQTVHDLVTGSRKKFRDLGPHALKGVPGKLRLFALIRK